MVRSFGVYMCVSIIIILLLAVRPQNQSRYMSYMRVSLLLFIIGADKRPGSASVCLSMFISYIIGTNAAESNIIITL